jgi:hypothetical protein
MQTDDILLLADQTFVTLKEETIKSVKNMIKNRVTTYLGKSSEI